MGKCAFQPIGASIVVYSRGSILISVLFVMIVLVVPLAAIVAVVAARMFGKQAAGTAEGSVA